MASILVVDDEQEIRNLSADMLRIEGHNVDTVKDGDEALVEAARKKYDLALVDLVLPGGLNGLDVIEKLRSMSPDLRIIACTGFGSVDIANKAVKAGANEFMTKPFWSKRLIDTVSKLLDGKSNDNSSGRDGRSAGDEILKMIIPKLLAGFPEDTIAEVMRLGRTEKVGKGGGFVVNCNSEIAFLRSGKARCWYRDCMVGTLSTGEAVGEASIFLRSDSDISMFLEADTAMELLIISKEKMKEYFSSHDKKLFTRFAASIILSLSSKLINGYEELVEVVQKNRDNKWMGNGNGSEEKKQVAEQAVAN
jgi:CheY-like chemotaxis protein